jgi:hypothetical protein
VFEEERREGGGERGRDKRSLFFLISNVQIKCALA